MKLHKRVKFPIELTKGKADDLYRLRFLRRSELEPLLRHTLRYNNRQMGRQLDIWDKEKTITIGSLNKEHEKVYQSQVRLRKELRRIKKEEYVRLQTQIREKLQAIRYRMIGMRVLRKFRENVDRNKRERHRDINKKLEVAKYVLSVPTQTDYPEDTDEFKPAIKDTYLSRAKAKQPKLIQRDTAIQSIQAVRVNTSAETSAYTNQQKSIKPTSQSRGIVGNVTDIHVFQGGTNLENDDVPMSLQGRYPSSKGSRMETILEENNDAVEMEIEDNVGRKLTLASDRLRSLNRSHSNRNIFDTKDQVPLLPDVTQRVTSQDKGVTEDKSTQTSFKHRRKKYPPDDSDDRHTSKKRLVVTLPSPALSPTSGKTTHSSNSTYGQFGSDTDDGYPESYDDTDEGFYFDSDTVEPSVEISTEQADSPSSDDTLKESDGRTLTITFDNYKQVVQRKQDNSAFSNALRHQEDVNLNDFPLRSVFPKQNPFSLRFKERSFYLKSSFDETRTSSARSERSNRSEFRKVTDSLEEIRDKRLADIRDKMMRQSSRTDLYNKAPSIAVFGVKADGRMARTVPPNTPQVHTKQGFGQRSENHPYSNLQADSQKQKKAHLLEKQRLHELVSTEPVQVCERSRQSLVSPVYSPRAISHDVSSMKNLYYRDKLLKAERDKIFNQNMRMRRFINTFEHMQECSYVDYQTRAPRTISRTSSKSSPGPKKTFGDFLFEVKPTGANELSGAKVVPPISVSPKRMLKDCRYLREYISVPDKDYTATFQERRTSWQSRSEPTSVYDNYVANVRIQLS